VPPPAGVLAAALLRQGNGIGEKGKKDIYLALTCEAHI
jgi:hypothetical protein